MSDIIDSEVILVNSGERNSGTTNNFNISLKLKRNDYNKLSVLEVYIPKSYYLFESTTFIINENGGGGDKTVSLSDGTYTRSGLKAELKKQLEAVGTNIYSITSDSTSTGPDTGKLTYTITTNNNGGAQPDLTFPDNQQPAESLGFTRNNTVSFVGDSLTSTGVINLQKENTVIINSSRCRNNIVQEILGTTTNNFASLVYRNPAPVESAKDIFETGQTFDFYLSNELREPIPSLNGQEYVFSILFLRTIDKITINNKLLAGILQKE